MNTPLDEPLGFTPAEDERPAGIWMEGYWMEIAIWSMRFAFLIFTYCGLLFLWYVRAIYRVMDTITGEQILTFLLPTIFYVPILLLAFFCLKFGKKLSQALKTGNQLNLEKAFVFLRWFLITALVLAGIWIIVAAGEWRSLIDIFLMKTSAGGETPLLTE